MINRPASEQGARLIDDLNAVHELWSAIQVGDQISLEADLEIDGQCVLRAAHRYTVVAKTDSTESGVQFDAFYVESPITGALVPVSPAFIGSYDLTSDQIARG